MIFNITVPNDKLVDVGKAFGIVAGDFDTVAEAKTALCNEMEKILKQKYLKYKRDAAKLTVSTVTTDISVVEQI